MAFLSALLAESVATDGAGRTTINNVFEYINLPALPTIFGPVSVVLRMEIGEEPLPGSLTTKLSVAGSDGSFMLMETMSVQSPGGPFDLPYLNMELRLAGLFLREYGKHTLNVSVEGFGSVDIPFIVKEAALAPLAEV